MNEEKFDNVIDDMYGTVLLMESNHYAMKVDYPETYVDCPEEAILLEKLKNLYHEKKFEDFYINYVQWLASIGTILPEKELSSLKNIGEYLAVEVPEIHKIRYFNEQNGISGGN